MFSQSYPQPLLPSHEICTLFCKARLQTNCILTEVYRAPPLHLFSVATCAGLQGAGASPSMHWVREGVDTGQAARPSVYHISEYRAGKS